MVRAEDIRKIDMKTINTYATDSISGIKGRDLRKLVFVDIDAAKEVVE